MTVRNQKRELASLARLISRGHAGYTLWDTSVKNEFEERLSDMYNGLTEQTDVKSFYKQVDGVLQILPDEHLKVSPSKGNLLPREPNPVQVGGNLCQDKNKKWEFSTSDDGKTAILALPALGNTGPNEWMQFSQEIDEKLFNKDGTAKYDSLTIDIRDNPGGAAVPFELLAKKLYGNEVAPFGKSAYRDTKEADYIRFINNEISRETYENRLKNHEYTGKMIPICDYTGHDKEFPPFAKGGFKKPITILTNKQTASAGESLCQFLKHHPGVTFVGENTAGCYAEISGEAVRGSFGAGIKIGSTHCFFENNEIFERKGFPVDLKTRGKDAFEFTRERQDLINARAQQKLEHYMIGHSPKPKEFNKIANNDFAFIRAINDGMNIQAVQNLYSSFYPEKQDKFEALKNYALIGEFSLKTQQEESSEKTQETNIKAKTPPVMQGAVGKPEISETQKRLSVS